MNLYFYLPHIFTYVIEFDSKLLIFTSPIFITISLGTHLASLFRASLDTQVYHLSYKYNKHPSLSVKFFTAHPYPLLSLDFSKQNDRRNNARVYISEPSVDFEKCSNITPISEATIIHTFFPHFNIIISNHCRSMIENHLQWFEIMILLEKKVCNLY